MGKILDTIVKYLPPPLIIIFVLTLFGGLMYVTKLFLDRTTQYTDGEKAGIYIGVSIPLLLISYVLVKIWLLSAWYYNILD